MKTLKIMILALILISSTGIYAQEVSKSRKPVLPKAGDIGFGIDLVPIFGYIGDMFNNSQDNEYNSFGGQEALSNEIKISNPSVSIMGKYMLTDNIALRANIGILVKKETNRSYVRDDAAFYQDPLSEAKVTDSKHTHSTGGSISLGAEYRRGYNRIQGYGGLDIIYGIERQRQIYEYGNAITSINQTPSRTNYETVTPPINVSYWTKTYVTGKYYEGNAQYIGFGAHAGVEIFLASHFSIGGEVTLYALGKFGRQCYQTQEGFNSTTNRVETRTELVSPGNKSFTFGTDNLGGKLYMMFYF